MSGKIAVKSSNQLAEEEFRKINEGTTNNQYVYLLVDYLNPEFRRLFKMKKTNPEEYERLHSLFTAIQWRESPEEVAKVIRGESPVSKEIPHILLAWFQNEASDKHRKDFFYYLANIATVLEL